MEIMGEEDKNEHDSNYLMNESGYNYDPLGYYQKGDDLFCKHVSPALFWGESSRVVVVSMLPNAANHEGIFLVIGEKAVFALLCAKL